MNIPATKAAGIFFLLLNPQEVYERNLLKPREKWKLIIFKTGHLT